MTAIEERLGPLARLPGDVLGLFTPAGVLTWVSPSIERTLGYTPERYSELVVLDVVHPDDHELVSAQWAWVIGHPGEERRLEYRVRHADGSWRWIDVIVTNLAEDPAVGSIVTNFRDVTERREALDALRTSERRFRALVQNSADVVLVIDPDGSITYANPATQDVFGRRPEVAISDQAGEFVHPDDLPALLAMLERATAEPGHQIDELVRVRHADGTWRWVESTFTNLIEDPQVAGIVCRFRDVTDRKLADDALHASEERLRIVLEHSRDVTGLLDSGGKVVWTSPGTAAMLGWESGALIGAIGFDLVHPDDLDQTLDRFATALATEEPVDPLLLRLATGDGGWLPVEIAAARWIEDGEIRGVVINLRDISYRLEAEQALRQSEERFRALVQNSYDGIIVITADANVGYVSASVEEMFGHPVHDMFDGSRIDWIHADDRDRTIEAFAEVLETPGTRRVLEARVLHADGTWRWTESAWTNLLDDPAVEGVVIHIRDVTERKAAQQALSKSEELFRSLAESSPTGIYRRDSDGNVVYVNGTWQVITGYSFDEGLDLSVERLVHPDDWHVLPSPETPETERVNATAVEFRVVRKDGEVRWVSLRTAPTYDDDGAITGRLGALEDITDRIEAQRDSQRLTDIFDATHDLVAIADTAGGLLYLNRSARRFFDLPEHGGGEQVENFDLFKSLAPESLDWIATEIQPALEAGGMWSGELTVMRPDGVAVPHLCQLLGHTGDTGEIEFFSGILHDISERKAFEYRLAHQATHDPLTGLPNRTLLLDRLDMALSRARRHMRRIAVLFLDLDHFKVVNDSLGHGLGDRLLIAIAERLKVALRPDDTIARFGGDEFVVLCEDLVTRQDAIAIAERVNEAISGPFVVDDAEVFVGVSIGIAFPDDRDADPETLIRDADAAMYQAKDRGRARWVVFDNAMRASAVDRLDIENALRRALERRELRVHYQPLIRLDTGRIEGVEALLRWEHPERGLLLPGDFIGVAEETGLIIPIGSWVLDQACRQVQRWQASNPDMPPLVLAVNLSGRQLGHPNLVEDVAVVLAEAGIDPGNVELEITESVLMDDVEMSEDTLIRLKTLGVKLVVDDFGTGYSSLSYLRRFPVDVLKVDRSFIAGLGDDPGDSAIVTAVVTLAHTLGLDAVAEGVETPEQLAELRRLECDKAQGYFIARPAAGPDIEAILSRNPTW